ncbi:MAG TPA: hypothetical protein IAC50_06815 [Candidatus Copromorpha excrementigallinarum]|uniref:Uncharacterized protein n=1 Tax=Candidatus Allocopromorpha excrementigallinarum TaxID=2840742 RepID=A0A9D1L5Z7_9FIRM|nr:hypothetical protein [Candidatus Copromorpha excrementigallinarum]
MKKSRIAGAAALALATGAAAAAAFILGIDPPLTNVAGAFGAAALWIIISAAVKVDDAFYFSALAFIFLASPVGSVLNLYRTWDPYDKVVHFISGFLLASFGMILVKSLMAVSVRKYGNIKRQAGPLPPELSSFEADSRRIYALPMIFAACMFSSGAAGLWEIFEFIADKMAGGEMQRGMADTVTDMMAGNLGALLYGVSAWIIRR